MAAAAAVAVAVAVAEGVERGGPEGPWGPPVPAVAVAAALAVQGLGLGLGLGLGPAQTAVEKTTVLLLKHQSARCVSGCVCLDVVDVCL